MNNDNPSSSDEWKLTAYVLGELSAQEEEEMKQQIERDPEVKKAVEEIERTTTALADSFKES